MSDIVGGFYLNGKIAQVLHAKHIFIYSTFSKQKLSELSHFQFEHPKSSLKVTQKDRSDFYHTFVFVKSSI